MSRNFWVPIDLNKSELRNVVIQNLHSNPVNPKTGQIYYNTSTKTILLFDGTSWLSLGSISDTSLRAESEVFSNVLVFDKYSKISKIKQTENLIISLSKTGNINDSYIILIIEGNGMHRISLSDEFEVIGNIDNTKINIIYFHYIDETLKPFATIKHQIYPQNALGEFESFINWSSRNACTYDLINHILESTTTNVYGAYAKANQKLASGTNGHIQFKLTNTLNGFPAIMGFNSTNTLEDYNGYEYKIFVSGNGEINYWSGSANISTGITATNNTILIIERISNSIVYKHSEDGITFTTLGIISNCISTDLFILCNINGIGKRLYDARGFNLVAI